VVVAVFVVVAVVVEAGKVVVAVAVEAGSVVVAVTVFVSVVVLAEQAFNAPAAPRAATPPTTKPAFLRNCRLEIDLDSLFCFDSLLIFLL
jgi:hypothetical protein